nr:hypothetical protein [Tanacetum cinerariifolium]
MPSRMRTRSAGLPAAESLRGGTGVRVSSGERGKRPREGNDEHVDDLNGQVNNQGMEANRGVEGVNGNVKGANGGAHDFLTIIAQQLQSLLPVVGLYNVLILCILILLALELMLLRTLRKICQVIKTVGEDLMLPSQIDVVG